MTEGARVVHSLGMRNPVRVLFLKGLLLSVCTGILSIGEADDGPGAYILCRNADVVRTLSVCKDPQDQTYRLIYTKSGRDEVKAVGKSYEFNMQKLQAIQDTLEKNNWKCRDVGAVSVVHDGDRGPSSKEEIPGTHFCK